MRVGLIALMHESNTFLGRPTTIEDFQRDLMLEGEAVRQLEESHHEIGGFFQGLREGGIEAVPMVAARATPAGPITTEAFREWCHSIELMTQFGRLDGVLVAPHGAAVSQRDPDADGAWLSLLRRMVGPDVPIIGTLDPHANLSPAMIAATDALIAYRTNPHLDQRERGIEAANLMARTLRGEVRPTQAAAFPPLMINIERQRTDEPHLVEQLAYADLQRDEPGVLSNSLILGFPYADVAEMGSSVIVVTDDNPAQAQRLADEWAAFLWDRRDQFIGQLIGVDEAIEFVNRNDGPICLLDMGDNVGGGSPGDGTVLAQALHEHRIGPSFVCLRDVDAIYTLREAAPGTRLRLAIGGKADREHGAPLQADFIIERVFDGSFEELQVRHGAIRRYEMGRCALLRTETGLTVLLTTHRVPPFSLGQITSVGLDPSTFRVMVAKGVHAPVAAYAPVCRHLVRVNTPGVTTADLAQLTYHHRRRPMYPFEPETTWPLGSTQT